MPNLPHQTIQIYGSKPTKPTMTHFQTFLIEKNQETKNFTFLLFFRHLKLFESSQFFIGKIKIWVCKVRIDIKNMYSCKILLFVQSFYACLFLTNSYFDFPIKNCEFSESFKWLTNDKIEINLWTFLFFKKLNFESTKQ